MLIVSGHMRSGSSLLVHILNTNPEIIGFGEMHINYRTRSDFSKAAYRCYRSFKRFPYRERYILDKVLHTRLMPSQELLTNTKTIFIIRTPAEALSSMLKLKIEMTKDNPKGAFDYYIERIRWIRKVIDILKPDKWTYVTYDELVNNHSNAFSKIESLLNLNNSLRTSYAKTWATGKPGVGDSGNNIIKGSIKKPKNKKIDGRVIQYVTEAEMEYEKCLNRLSEKNMFT